MIVEPKVPRSGSIRERRSMLNRLWEPWQAAGGGKESPKPIRADRERADAASKASEDRKLARHSHRSLIRTLRQISRDKTVPVELRVRCCELLVLVDPTINFNVIEPPWKQGEEPSGQPMEPKRRP